MINDPDLYARMSAGHSSITASRKAISDFIDDVNQLREKYVIRDMVIGVGAIANVEGEQLYLTSGGFRGTPAAALKLIGSIGRGIIEDYDKDAERKESK